MAILKFAKYLLLFLNLSFVTPQASGNEQTQNNNDTTINVDKADTAWMIVSSLLVMVMTPALGFFYGGLVKTKNTISMMGQCLVIYTATALLWTLVGFSLVFGKSQGGLIGDSSNFALIDVGYQPKAPYGNTIPFFLFYFFQTKFACITPALIIGATAEKIRLFPMLVFSLIWSLFVYCPIAHWIWNSGGWLNILGVKDFAGGTVIHISAGTSALAIALVLDRNLKRQNASKLKQSKRKPSDASILNLVHRHSEQHKDIERINVTFSKNALIFLVIGTMLLWFGWFGFNGGSALAANGQAVLAVVNTNLAPCASLIMWLLLDVTHKRHPTVSGMCIGAISGLAGVTQAAGFVRVWAAIIIGILSAILPYYFVHLREKYKLFDDRLDVFGCHGMGGFIGAVTSGLFYCDIGVNNECNTSTGIGAVYGNANLLAYQIIGALAAASWAFLFSTAIFHLIILMFKISNENVDEGIDKADYHEYVLPETEFKEVSIKSTDVSDLEKEK